MRAPYQYKLKMCGGMEIVGILLLVLGAGMVSPGVGYANTGGATLSLSPASGSFLVGSTFNVSVFVNTGGSSINAIGVGLTFPPDKLQVVSPSGGGSILSLWTTQPEFSNIEGTLRFQGGLPSPGIITSSGLITTITFRVKSPGEAVIQFMASSQVLRNDGRGTNILNSLGGGKYEFVIPPPEGPVVISFTHSDQNKWYRNSSPAFSWAKEEGVSEFSYDLDTNPLTIPDSTSEGVATVHEYTEIEDGIWYFHIKARKAAWGGVTHLPVFIDTGPPARFSPEINPKYVIEGEKSTLTFATTDNASGLDHYELKIERLDNTDTTNAKPVFFEASSPYQLSPFNSGKYKIIIRAYDQAGNWTEEEVLLAVSTSALLGRITSGDLRIYAISLVLLGGFLIGALIVIRVSRRWFVAYNTEKIATEVGHVFDELEKDLLLQLEEFEKVKTKRELTEKEKELHDKIIAELNLSEGYLKHQLGDRQLKKKEE